MYTHELGGSTYVAHMRVSLFTFHFQRETREC